MLVKTLRAALSEVFSKRHSFFYFILGTLGFGTLYIYAPIALTPGNTLLFFLQITPWWALGLLFILALLMGVQVAMQAYLWKKQKSLRVHEIGAGLGAGFSSFIAGIFSSATCAACITPFFSYILPVTGIFSLIKYRGWITGAGLILVLSSIMLTSSRIINGCTACGVTHERK